MTQTEKIMYLLRHGAELTPKDALDKCGCFRLAARVFEARAKGYNIKDKWIETETGAKVKAYYLTQDNPGPA